MSETGDDSSLFHFFVVILPNVGERENSTIFNKVAVKPSGLDVTNDAFRLMCRQGC